MIFYGAQSQDADISEHTKDTVFVRQKSCEEPIENVFAVLLQFLPGMRRNSTIPSVRVVETSNRFPTPRNFKLRNSHYVSDLVIVNPPLPGLYGV